ncbi:MAG: CYTH domain-containing protein [Lachnospiraceae bacterium]|nr:CYTH domain-containing protein [Lachnospiraceae bacterium]
MGFEIERKFLVREEEAEKYIQMAKNGELAYHELEQAYLTTNPVVRVRRTDDKYSMTYKAEGLMIREEYNMTLTKEAFETLASKADGNVIRKTRILIPYKKHLIEFDVFKAPFDYLKLAEVEFDSKEEAEAFTVPDWFLKEVTGDTEYHNSTMSRKKFD